MVKVMPEQLELLHRLCSSETNRMNFMNQNAGFGTLDMRVPLMPVLFAGDNHTTTQLEY
jgi:hypothetical protein